MCELCSNFMDDDAIISWMMMQTHTKHETGTCKECFKESCYSAHIRE